MKGTIPGPILGRRGPADRVASRAGLTAPYGRVIAMIVRISGAASVPA